jgi:SAM-dependent methyltransferase
MHTGTMIKDRIRHYWEGSAQTYDGCYGHGLKTAHEKSLWLDLLSRNIGISRELRILDVGCGTGFLSLLLAEQGHTVTGIDLSPEMRTKAAEKAKKAELNISFIPGDAEEPPFSQQSFDVIVSRHVAWTLPSPQKALENWKALLAPGGAVVIIDGVWTPRDPGSKIRFLLADFIRLLQGQVKHFFWAGKYAAKGELPFFGGAEPETIIKHLQDCGYKEIWMDSMEVILAHEHRHGPLEYRLTHGKNRRYLIGGRI